MQISGMLPTASIHKEWLHNDTVVTTAGDTNKPNYDCTICVPTEALAGPRAPWHSSRDAASQLVLLKCSKAATWTTRMCSREMNPNGVSSNPVVHIGNLASAPTSTNGPSLVIRIWLYRTPSNATAGKSLVPDSNTWVLRENIRVSVVGARFCFIGDMSKGAISRIYNECNLVF